MKDALLAKGWTKQSGYWKHADTPESKITVLGERWYHTVRQFNFEQQKQETLELGSGRGGYTLRKHLGYFHRSLEMKGGS